jgi:L-amino acid N-acyltransferase YncA
MDPEQRASDAGARGDHPAYRLGVTIRPATDADWPAIWPFFREIVKTGETYAYPKDLDVDAARALWMEPPPGQTVVCVEDGRVLGSAKMGPNRPGRGAHIATASFMVNPDAQGRGVGRKLGEYAVQWAREAGYAGMQFNAVVETNVAAVALWKALASRSSGRSPRRSTAPAMDASACT